MNVKQIKEGLRLIQDGLLAPDVTDDEWIEFGRAVAAAIRANYCPDAVICRETKNDNWQPEAERLWKAAGPLGLHGHKYKK